MNISPSITKVGKYPSGVHNIIVHQWGEGNVEIGAFCSIAKDVHIMLGGAHNSRALSTYGFGYVYQDVFKCLPPPPFTEKPNVIIGNDVWIGRWVTIMRGVTIGDGAIIAARSHVFRDVSPYETVGGNPAQHINWRFTVREVEALLAAKWWDLPDDEINDLIPYLVTRRIYELVEQVNIIRNGE